MQSQVADLWLAELGALVALWLAAQAPRATVWALALALLLMASTPTLWLEVPYEGARGQAILAALLLVGLAAAVTGLARPRPARGSKPS